MTTGTIGLVAPPPVETPPSHAVSCGAVGVVPFTANIVWLGTKAEAALSSVETGAAT